MAESAYILKKKQALLSLEQNLNKRVIFVCTDGTEGRGYLKGFDDNANLVLSDAELYNDKCSRYLGTAVVRGGSLCTVISGNVTLMSDPFA
jgi:small nuclear ribonucleoprotein (snRNP)-like protein